jgi:hypothetical protein
MQRPVSPTEPVSSEIVLVPVGIDMGHSAGLVEPIEFFRGQLEIDCGGEALRERSSIATFR